MLEALVGSGKASVPLCWGCEVRGPSWPCSSRVLRSKAQVVWRGLCSRDRRGRRLGTLQQEQAPWKLRPGHHLLSGALEGAWHVRPDLCHKDSSVRPCSVGSGQEKGQRAGSRAALPPQGGTGDVCGHTRGSVPSAPKGEAAHRTRVPALSSLPPRGAREELAPSESLGRRPAGQKSRPCAPEGQAAWAPTVLPCEAPAHQSHIRCHSPAPHSDPAVSRTSIPEGAGARAGRSGWIPGLMLVTGSLVKLGVNESASSKRQKAGTPSRTGSVCRHSLWHLEGLLLGTRVVSVCPLTAGLWEPSARGHLGRAGPGPGAQLRCLRWSGLLADTANPRGPRTKCFAEAGKMEPNRLFTGFGPLQPAVAAH